MIFCILYLFGISIEYAQEYSKKFHLIHGHYDIEDVYSNLKGLTTFSTIWISYVAFLFGYNRWMIKKGVNNGANIRY